MNNNRNMLYYILAGFFSLNIIISCTLPQTKYSLSCVLVPILGGSMIFLTLRQNSALFYSDMQKDSGKKLFLGGLVVVLLSCMVIFYHLGDIQLENDEFYVLLTATGYNNTGKFVLWDLANDCAAEPYTRGWPYTLIVAYIIRLFGVSEFSLKLLSACSGVVLIVLIYYTFCKLWKNFIIAFIGSCTVLLNPSIVKIFRTARMYSFSLLLAYLMYILIYYVLGLLDDYKANINKIIISGIFICMLIPLNYIVMPNALIPGIGVVIYIVVNAIYRKKYAVLYGLGGIGILGGIILLLYKFKNEILPGFLSSNIYQILSLIDISGTNHLSYIWDSISFAGYVFLGGVMLCAILFLVFYQFDNEHLEFIRYLACMYISGIAFLAFVSDRYYAYRYMNILAVFACLLIGLGIFWTCIDNKIYIIAALLFISLGINYGNKSQSFYFSQRSDFLGAFAKLEGYFDSNDTLNEFASYVGRNYYLLKFYPNINCFKAPTKSNLVMDGEGNYLETELDDFMQFGIEARHGLVWFEGDKLGKYTDTFIKMLNTGTNLIDEDSIASTNVYMYEYEFADDYNDVITSFEYVNESYSYSIVDGNLIIAFEPEILANSKLLGISLRYQGIDTVFSKRYLINCQNSQHGIFVIRIPGDYQEVYLENKFLRYTYNNVCESGKF